MNFEQMALTRQSTRNYDASKDVEMEKLVRICELGMLAPSACNSQPWKLHILKLSLHFYTCLLNIMNSLYLIIKNKF